MSTITRKSNTYTSRHFFVDNSAAAGANFDPKPQPGQLYAAKFHRKMARFLDNDPTRTIEIAWCPSHCKIDGNDRADELAKEATQLAWNTPISTSRAFALLRAKASTQSAWVRDWQRAPRKGRYAISNRIPPSLNPHQTFYRIKRPVRNIWTPDTVLHWTRVHR